MICINPKNIPSKANAAIKLRSSKFQPFNKFPEQFDSCQEDEHHPYYNASSSKYPVEFKGNLNKPSFPSRNNALSSNWKTKK